MDVAELATVIAVQDLLSTYARRCDERDVEAWTALFTDDALFVVRDVEHRGQAIRGWLVAQMVNPPGCHALSNVVVTPDGSDRATARNDFVFVRRQGGEGPWEFVNVGFYESVAVRGDDGWRFAQLLITLR